jgi:peptidoglycan/xylan/chitin deacetylase (PgdA/CDA1 family)
MNKRLKEKIQDKRFHLLLFCIIAALALTTLYYRYYNITLSPYQEALSSKISKFESERSLQLKPEKIKPGSIKVPILIYHSVRPHTETQTAIQRYYDVAPEQFEKQLQYLKDHNYVVISLDYLVEALQQNTLLPPKSVVITLDDGWRNQYAYAFPLLQKYHDTATFFIFTNAIDHDLFLTWDQVRVMNNSGMTIGGHTKTHPYLPDITDPIVLRDEITASKKVIEDQIGQKIDLFAYPYGHYRDDIIDIVKESGYAAARSTYKGINHTRQDLYTLKGIEVSDDFEAFTNNINY